MRKVIKRISYYVTYWIDMFINKLMDIISGS